MAIHRVQSLQHEWQVLVLLAKSSVEWTEAVCIGDMVGYVAYPPEASQHGYLTTLLQLQTPTTYRQFVIQHIHNNISTGRYNLIEK